MELTTTGNNFNNATILIDDDDFEKINKFKWYISRSAKDKYYIANRNGQRLHRLITDCQDGMEVDHINGNTFDNRKVNLRICSRSENSMNRKKSNNKSSIYKGVSLYKRDMNWVSYIKINGKKISLGYFETEKEAAFAYNTAAIKYFGEFALLNIID